MSLNPIFFNKMIFEKVKINTAVKLKEKNSIKGK